eukprot:5376573-Amphidinium_carterae.3
MWLAYRNFDWRHRHHHVNKLTGALPEAGFQSMTALILLRAQHNQFSGSLPGPGIERLRALKHLGLDQNRLAGMLPDLGIRWLTSLV